MSRPQSGKARRAGPGVTAPRGMKSNDGISYEDLLVAQYLDELRRSPQYTKNSTRSEPSPYLQKLTHTHIVPTQHIHVAKQRPMSAKNRGGGGSGGSGDDEGQDDYSPRPMRKTRPTSAPVYRRPISAAYTCHGSRPQSAKLSVYGKKKVRSQYKRQTHTIVAVAYKNGSRDTFARVAAPTFGLLLEECTDKLLFSSAVRRVFLDDGTEVFSGKEIPRDAEIFVSTGETYKDPYHGVKKTTQQQKTMTWTMSGLQWDPDTKTKKTKTKLSKRFRSLIETSRRRVLVFRNGRGTEGSEIVADPDKFEDFMFACTSKLDMGSYARVLFDWEGNELDSLSQAPVLDQCLQTWSTPVLGPVWVSKGEGFSPKGVHDFLTGLISYTKMKLKEAKHYRQQLKNAQNEDTKEKVEIVAILSMSESEIEETLEIVAKDVEDFSNALNRLKQQQDKIQSQYDDEQGEGFKYTQKHIDQMDSNHRMVGARGIRLKVYANGTYEDDSVVYFNLQQASRGIDQQQLMARLLDQCSGAVLSKAMPSVRPVARKLYDNMGKEIKSVHNLEYDQEVWVSYGEVFQNPFTFAVTSTFDKVRFFEIEGKGDAVTREQLMVEDVAGQDRANCWECVQGIPEDAEKVQIGENMDPMEKEALSSQLEMNQLSSDSSFLRNKKRSDLVIFGEVVMDTKKKRGNKDVWPSDAQSWIFQKSGYICSKAMPQLVLTVTESKLTTSLGHPTKGKSDTKVQGFAVSLAKKASEASQQWRFTSDGYMYAQSQPELVLTYLGARFGDEDTAVENEETENAPPKGHHFFIAVCERLEGREVKTQRWAIKQEKFDNKGQGQWRHTKALNPEWNKQALTWPVDENGELIEDFEWPLEGGLSPYAPPLNKTTKPKGVPATSAPLRLMAMKNGTRDVSKAVAVVGPDLTNMKKDGQSKKNKGKKGHQKQKSHEHKNSEDEPIHCDEDLTVLKLEFILFLERCTSMLDMPFAARRMFDENGKEHFTLRNLTRDQLVYVSCNEAWSDPNLSKAEQQRRYLLSNLSSDVARMRQYVALRNPERLVLEVSGGLVPGAKMTVNICALEPENEEPTRPKTKPLPPNKDGTSGEAEMDFIINGKMTAHDKSHQKAEERHNKLKWPWERVMNAGFDEEDDGDEQHYSNKDMYKKFKPKQQQQQTNPTMQAQKFTFEDGYIVCTGVPSLVLGVHEQEGRVPEVTLTKKNPDNIHQRWIVQETGFIQSKHNPQMVLTVSMPSDLVQEGGDNTPVTYQGCPVVLTQRKNAQFGRANQRWYFDKSTGFILAFHTDTIDKEVTAANKANVCTFAVMGDTEIDQPGYEVEVPGSKGSKSQVAMVCMSCARAMRGRFKVSQVKGQVDFACTVGAAKEKSLKSIGSFQCLNGKVDLSTYEAEHTLDEWEEQLDKLREELSVRAIAHEISAARTPYTVKVLAYKNGDGRFKPGELIVGSSVQGIMEQATERLNLPSAGRRVYTADGTIILDLDDLVHWSRMQCVETARQQLRDQAKAKKSSKRKNQLKDDDTSTATKSSSGPVEVGNLMSRVELEESSEAEQEDENAMLRREEIKDNRLTVGFEVKSTRTQMDPWKNFMLIPNPMNQVHFDGMVTEWQFSARKSGTIFLQIFRPSADDPTSFLLVDQLQLDIEEPGDYSVDMQNARGDGPQMLVKHGDITGFYCPGVSIIPYDINESAPTQAPFYSQPRTPPGTGDSVTMDSWMQVGCRQYSLCAIVIPAADIKHEEEEETEKTAKKSKNGDKDKGPHVEPPPIDMVLRYPIEVWVACGENFVKPEKVEKQYEKELQAREERAAVAYELKKKKVPTATLR